MAKIPIRKIVDALQPPADAATRAQARIQFKTDDELKTFARQELFPEGMEKFAGNINLERIAEPNDVKGLIDDVVREMPGVAEGARRGTIESDQLRLLADEVGMSAEMLLARPQGEAWNAERILAARGVLANQRAVVSEMAAGIRTRADDSTQAMLNFRRELSKYAAMQMQMHGLAAEAGRALQQFNQHIKSGMFATRELEELIEVSGGEEVTRRMADQFLKVQEEGGTKAAAQYARNAHHARGMDMLNEFFINSILSGPGTHIVNLLGSNLTALALPFERMIAGLFPGDITVREGLEGLVGLVEGYKDGLRLFGRAFVEGEPLDNATKIDFRERQAITKENAKALLRGRTGAPRFGISPDTLNGAGAFGQFIDFLAGMTGAAGTAVRLPTRFLLAEDEMMKGVLYRSELRMQAYRMARQPNETRSAADIRQAILEQRAVDFDMVKTAERLADQGLDHVHMGAIDAGRYGTFQKQLGASGTSFTAAMNRIPLARLVMPFIRTPINLLKFAGERSPFAALHPGIRDDILGADPVRRQLALQKIATGSGAMAAMAGTMAGLYSEEDPWGLASDFYISGGPPPDRDLARQLRDQGWQEYSIKVNGKWHAYNRLDPLGWTIGVTADFMRVTHLGREEFQGKEGTFSLGLYAAAVGLAVGENAVNKTYLRGLSDVLDAITSGEPHRWERLLANYATAFTPFSSMQRFIQQVVPPEEHDQFLAGERLRRNVDGVFEQVCQNVIGCSPDAPPLTDYWGRVKPAHRGWAIYSSQSREGEPGFLANAEMVRLGMHPGIPEPSFDGMPLDRWDQFEYLQTRGTVRWPEDDGTTIEGVSLAGKTVLEALDTIVLSPAYAQHMSDGTPEFPGSREKVLRRFIDAYSKLAFQVFAGDRPDLMQRYEQFIQQRAQMQTQGVEELLAR